MKKETWLVGPTGWQYNDEIYYSSHYGNKLVDMNCVYVCESEQEAKELQFKLTAQHIRSKQHPEFYQTFYGYEEVIDKYTLEEIFPEISLDDDWEFTLPINATDEQIKQLMRAIGPGYFYPIAKAKSQPKLRG